MPFFAEIKRRHILQVAVVYAVVGWGLIEIVSTVEEPLGLPGWVDTFAIVFVVIGFPLALAVSWIFDLTPKGVVRTKADEDTGAEAPRGGDASAKTQPEKREVLRNSVAILPLENLSPNPDDAYFAAGIHEEILNYVTKINDVNVIARTSVRKYANTDKTIAEIAGELGVGTIMEGSVRYAGNRVRVTAQLIDAATENHLWSEVYERKLADIFEIQADIAQKIADALEAELTADEKASLEKLPTSSTEAYSLYLRAFTLYQQRGDTIGASPEQRRTVEDLLDDALGSDPNFAAAYVLRAKLLISTLNQDPGEKGEDIAVRRAALEARATSDLHKALEIDSESGAAYAAIGRIHQFNWRGKEALKAYRKALDLAPNDADLLTEFAVFLVETKNLGQSLDLIRRAVTLDPNSGARLQWFGWILMCGREFSEAREVQRRGLSLAPGNNISWVVAATIEICLGNIREAEALLRRAESLVQDDLNPAYLAELTRSYGMLGLPDDARRIFAKLEQFATSRRVPAIVWALAYLGTGDREQALEALKKATEHPEPYVAYFSQLQMKRNPYRHPMLDEPEFAALRDKLGYQDLSG